MLRSIFMTEEDKNTLKEDSKKAHDTMNQLQESSQQTTTTENGITTTTTKRTDYSFSESTYETEHKGSTYSVKTNKTVDSTNPENNMIFTTTVLNVDGKKIDYIETVTTSDKFNINSGYQHSTKTIKRTENSYKNGNPKTVTTTRSESTLHETGSINYSFGGRGQATNSKTTTSEEHYNKKGELTDHKTSTEVSTPSYSSISHNKTSYDKEDIKKYMQAHANVYNGYLHFSLESNDFYANKQNGEETYTHQKGEKITEIRVKKDGNISGGIYNSNKEKLKNLSDKELKKELQKARKETDKRLKKLTDGDIKNVEEYMASIPYAPGYDVKISLGDYFENPLPQNFDQIKENFSQTYQERFEASKSGSTSTLAAQQMRLLTDKYR
jgi:hypothetical protein